MLTGDLRNKVDQVWNAFWSGGIANPIEVIEQITYLFSARASTATRPAKTTSPAPQNPARALIPAGVDAQGRPHDNMRWSRFKNMAPAEMFDVPATRSSPSCAACKPGGPAAESAFCAPCAMPASPSPRRFAGQGGRFARHHSAGRPRHQGATCTNTCSAKSPLPGKTASSTPRPSSI